MKTKTKRLSALFMAFAMSVSVLQATAFAAGDVVHDTPNMPAGCVGHSVTVQKSTLKIDGATGKYHYNVRCDEDYKTWTESGTAETVHEKAASCTTTGTIVYRVKFIDGTSEDRTFSAGSKLGHSYTYTFVWPKDSFLTKGENTLPVTVIGTCTDCGAKAENLPVTEIKQGTVVKNDKCKPGSVTFTATYTEPAKNPTRSAGKTFTDTKTYAYFEKAEDAIHTPSAKFEVNKESKVLPTCTENGVTEWVKRCTHCGEITSSYLQETGKLGHTAAAAKKENVVKATYAKAGSYDLVTRCADCGKVLNSTHKTVAKLKVNAPTLSSVKNVKGKKATVAWKKASSVSGTQVQYATNKSFKSAKSVKTTASSKTISKLSKNKKYYVRVRSYKVVSGKTYYSSWSSVKTVTIKK